MSRYETYSPLTFNDFKKKNLHNLLIAIATIKDAIGKKFHILKNIIIVQNSVL